MDSNDLRQSPQAEQPPIDGVDRDWRGDLQSDFRRRIVSKITNILKRCLPISGQGVQELQKIAARFEDKIYTAATNKSDYLEKISWKILSIESRSNHSMPNAMPSSSAGMERNPQYPAILNMQLQVQNQGQSLPIPMVSNQLTAQGQQQLTLQNIQSDIGSAGMQISATLSSALPSFNSLVQHPIPNVAQNSNMQNVSRISQHSVVQGADSNRTNPQKQIQQRQNIQLIGPPQRIQQSQNPQQYLYQPQQQQQLLNQKLHEGGNPQPLLQPQIQQHAQQNMLKPAQLQSSEQLHNSSLMQPPVVSVIQQSLPSSSQQQDQQPIHEKHPHQNSRQAAFHHQTQVSQQPMLQSPQQHEQEQLNLMAQHQIVQHTSISDMQQWQPQGLLSQENNISCMSGLMGQQNNTLDMHQQQFGSRSHVGQLPQQQEFFGQSDSSSMQIMQQPDVSVHRQTPNVSTLFSGGGKQHSQQEMMRQMPSEMEQLQQQFILQQQPKSVEHNMQQKLHASNPLLQHQNVIDHQKAFQTLRATAEEPYTSLDSTPQTGNSGDWQEEVYQKIKVLKDKYFAHLSEMYHKICIKLQQLESLPGQTKTDVVEKLIKHKRMLEGSLQYLQVTKNNVQQYHKDRLGSLEKHIVSVLLPMFRKPAPPMLKRELPAPHMQSFQQPQQTEAQIPQTQSHDCGMNSQLQSPNLQSSSVPTVQPRKVSDLLVSMSSASTITSSQQKTMNSGLGEGSARASVQQVATGSIQQSPSSSSQQASMTTNASQSNSVHSNISSLQTSSNMLPRQHMKQHQKQGTIQQKQQLIEPRQLHEQQVRQQKPRQLLDVPQLGQRNNLNDLNTRQDMDLKPRCSGQNLSKCERYPQEQRKPGCSFPSFSPQVPEATSPHINQHSSHIDEQDLLPPLTRVGTPLQSMNSPSLVPSPSTSLGPSPMPGDHEKPNTTVSSLNDGSIIHRKTCLASSSKSSLAMGTPRTSASPLLPDLSPPDSHGNTLNTVCSSGKFGVTQQSLHHLLEVVKSMSSTKALNESVTDIASIVNMIDRIAGSAPGNGSGAAVAEDLAEVTKCRLHAMDSITQDGSIGVKRMRHCTRSMPLNVASSVGSLSDSFTQLSGSETSDLDSSATSGAKRPKTEINPALLEEIKDINERLIDTVVDISDNDVGPNLSAATVEGAKGTFIKCSFSAVALCPNLKSQYASSQMMPIQPLRLLVPVNYPNCSPILLDKFSLAFSKDYDDLSFKAKSRLSVLLRTRPEPISLTEIARAWGDCARSVITEYAMLRGGGTFSSKYGTLDNCLSIA